MESSPHSHLYFTLYDVCVDEEEILATNMILWDEIPILWPSGSQKKPLRQSVCYPPCQIMGRNTPAKMIPSTHRSTRMKSHHSLAVLERAHLFYNYDSVFSASEYHDRRSDAPFALWCNPGIQACTAANPTITRDRNNHDWVE